jgi:hypothetical protein
MNSEHPLSYVIDLILLYLAVLLIPTPILYNYGVSIVTDYFSFIRSKNICLIIAHPDDEAVYFACLSDVTLKGWAQYGSRNWSRVD